MNVGKSEITLTETPAGVLRVGKTRVSLDSVIIAFNQGYTPEDILCSYDSLTLPEVYATISYYLQHRTEVDAYLAERQQKNEELRVANEARFNHKGLRERLLARRRQAA